MNKPRSFAARVVLAIALMIGFYVLALVIIGGLLYLPYAEWHFAGRLHIKLALIAVVTSLAILWSILPRIDRFEDPGARLKPERQKALFEVIRNVSEKTGVEMPAEVFLVPEVNAWVAQRGGLMGFGSRRIMGLGLPLLEGISVSEMEAVLCHEMGHFHGGDTSLGPWIYKTRGAIGRTLMNLGNEGWVHKPFEWYGNFFMRVTQAISRGQELAADALAASINGPGALSRGLQAVHRLAPAYEGYWSSEIVPLLQRGFLPPLASGFSAFIGAEEISGQLEKLMQKEMEEPESRPWDSHPPLPERLAALAALPEPPGLVPDDRPAVTLLNDLLALEKEMMAIAFGGEILQKLQSVEWSRLTDAVWKPEWQTEATAASEALGDLTIDQLPTLIGEMTPFIRKLPLDDVPAEHRMGVAQYMIGCAIAGVLIRDGWNITILPGERTLFRKKEEQLDPFGVMSRFWSEDQAGAEWVETCGRLRLTGQPLRWDAGNASVGESPSLGE